MVFVLLMSVLFMTPYLTYIGRRCGGWAVLVGGEEFKWCQPVHHQLWSQQTPYFILHSMAKTMIKAHFSGRMVSGISDVVIASVYSEKTRLKS